MTSRKRFERWAKRHELTCDLAQEMTRDGPRWYYMQPMTEAAWQAWQASKRAFT